MYRILLYLRRWSANEIMNFERYFGAGCFEVAGERVMRKGFALALTAVLLASCGSSHQQQQPAVPAGATGDRRIP